MAKLARETSAQYYPATVDIYIDDVKVSAIHGISPVLRTASIRAVVVNPGPVNKTTNPSPPKFRWTFVPLSGCDNLKFLSPTSSTTRLEIINPTDTWVIILEVSTQFETLTRQIEVQRYDMAERVWFFPTEPLPFAPQPAQGFSSVAVSDIGEIAVLDDSGSIWITTDGIVWTNVHTVALYTPVPSLMLGTIAYGGGGWIAIMYHDVIPGPLTGPATIMRSLNGIDWTEAVFPTATWLDIEFRGGKFVAVGFNTIDAYVTTFGIVATSTDGVTWDHQDQSAFSLCFGIEYIGGLFVIAGASSDNSEVITVVSSDAITWTPGASSVTDGNIVGFTADDEKFIIRAYGELSTSTDGVVWTTVPLTHMIPWPGHGETDEWGFTDIAFDGTAYAAGSGFNGVNGYVFNSPDLVTWTKVDGSPEGNRSWTRTAFGGGIIATVSDSGHFAMSHPITP